MVERNGLRGQSDFGASRRGLVTPEAVLLDFEVAGLASRLLSRMLDLIALSIGMWILSFAAQFASFFVGETGLIVIVIVGGAILFFGYPIVGEVKMRGRTFGKQLLGLRVVTNEGGPVRARHAIVRSMFQVVDVFLAIGVISGILTARTQRLGDLVAGTFVVREPKAGAVSGAVMFPPPRGYEGYVAMLDVTTVKPEQYEVVRSFLLRVLELAPGPRHELALRLANPLARQINAVIPPNLHPELFLVCLIAAYQNRHRSVPYAYGWAPPVAPATPWR